MILSQWIISVNLISPHYVNNTLLRKNISKYIMKERCQIDSLENKLLFIHNTKVMQASSYYYAETTSWWQRLVLPHYPIRFVFYVFLCFFFFFRAKSNNKMLIIGDILRCKSLFTRKWTGIACPPSINFRGTINLQ